MKIINNKFNIFEKTFDLEIEGCDQIYMVTCKEAEISDIITDFKIENPEVLNL